MLLSGWHDVEDDCAIWWQIPCLAALSVNSMACNIVLQKESARRPNPYADLLGFVAFTGFVAPVVVAVVRARRRPGTRTSPDGPLSAVPGIVAFVRAQLP